MNKSMSAFMSDDAKAALKDFKKTYRAANGAGFEALPIPMQDAVVERFLREFKNSNAPAHLPKEINGRKGPEPTRFGDWESKGIVSDF